jgi:hypothetical protein
MRRASIHLLERQLGCQTGEFRVTPRERHIPLLTGTLATVIIA